MQNVNFYTARSQFNRRLKKIFSVAAILLAMTVVNTNVHALDKTSTGFYWPIGKSNFDQACGPWIEKGWDDGCYFDNKYHIYTIPTVVTQSFSIMPYQ